MREDIVTGLKNAVQRGETLEKAVQSFINAGYNPVEVKQAAESIYEGATSIINPETGKKVIQEQSLQQHVIQSSKQIPIPENQIQKPIQKPVRRKGNMVLIIILVLILLALLSGLIYIIFYGQDLLNKFFP
ncbi:MAG: hypothetical protein AABX83_03905 [Nanoarchaeota archaeon]